MSLFPQQQQLKGIILSKYPSKFRVIFDGFLSNLLFDPYVFLLSSFPLSVSIFSLILLFKPSPSLVWQLQYLLVSLLPVSFLSKSSHALLPDNSLSKPNPDPTLAPRCMPAVVKAVGYSDFWFESWLLKLLTLCTCISHIPSASFTFFIWKMELIIDLMQKSVRETIHLAHRNCQKSLAALLMIGVHGSS